MPFIMMRIIENYNLTFHMLMIRIPCLVTSYGFLILSVKPYLISNSNDDEFSSKMVYVG
jgi:hypothetical protein